MSLHLVPSVVLRDNELLPMDIDTWKMQEENILTAWQTPVSVQALIGWLHAGSRLQVQVMDFSSITHFSNMLCAVKFKGFRPHGLYVIVKALPQVCMKNTARGECRVVNTARGECYIYHETPLSAVFHTHKHRQCFKWHIVLDHSQLIHVVVM